jgi:hypothetical protein
MTDIMIYSKVRRATILECLDLSLVELVIRHFLAGSVFQLGVIAVME